MELGGATAVAAAEALIEVIRLVEIPVSTIESFGRA
jgi:hypothetical protein